MSIITNTPPLLFSLTETEQRLMTHRTKLDLTLYEKNSMNKVNFRSHLGKNHICSTPDKYKKIRIPIVALFIKLLSSPTEQNFQRLNKIKQLIYDQKLEEIVKKHGITAEELLANFAFAFQELQIGSERIESQFIKKINSEPFFDKIIMECFWQVFFKPGEEGSLTANISKWIKQELEISIVFVQNQNEVETQSLIFLKKNEKHQILRVLKSFNICSMTSIFDEELRVETPSKLSTDFQSKKGNFQQNLLRSISSCQSPTVRFSSNRKQNDQYVAISMQNSLELIQNKENNDPQESYEQETNGQKIKMRKIQKPEGSTFWKIFCCRAD